MQNKAGEYRAICFDLDGTLLPMDIDEFMSEYFRRIAKYVGQRGLDSQAFMAGLKAGTKKMATHTGDELNMDAFWNTFFNIYKSEVQADFDRDEVLKIANDFYAEEFPHIGDGFKGNPAAQRVVEKLAAKKYPMVLTTMPMFPRLAVEHRLRWAGVDPQNFARITSYENSKAVKPRQTYYAENLAAMNVEGKDVLMVGNNTMEDLAFLDLGVDAFLVTDWLLDPIGFDISSVKHGNMDEFEAWVDTLPVCTNPAESISTGAVSLPNMEAAFKANAIRDIDLADAGAKAAAVADAVAGDHKPGAASKLKIEAGC